MKLITAFISKTKQIYTKTLTVSENRFHFLTPLELYVSSYLQTKTFARKRDCTISSKLQMPRR